MRAMCYLHGVLLAVLTICVFAGCRPTAGRGGKPRTPSREAHRAELETLDWRQLGADQLIDLLSGSPIECRKALVDGPVVRAYAARELSNRLETEGNGVLTESQRERLTRSLRSALPDCRTHSSTDSPVLELAARHDPDFAARFFLEHKDMMASYADIAFRAIRSAGLLEEARRVLERRMRSCDEFEACMALDLVARGGIEQAADAVYARTNAMRWLVRLEALWTLDRLDDPRINQALRAHFHDIERTSIGLRVLAGPKVVLMARMFQSGRRGELVKALVRRKVEGADDFLEKLALDRWQGHTTVRWLAGIGLARLDRQRGLSVLRRLLQSRDESDQETGVEIADSHDLKPLALEVKQELQELAQESPFEWVRRGAAQALRGLDSRKKFEEEEPHF